MRRLLALPLGVLLSLFMVSCTEQQAGTASDTTSTPAPDTLTVARTDTVRVTLSASGIDMPTSLRPGPTVFRVRNAGEQQHSFVIEGEGAEHMLESPPAPGDMHSLKVRLRPGTYEVSCPVGDHAEGGMRLTLAVEGNGASS